MKKALLSSAITVALGMSAAVDAAVLTFADSTADINTTALVNPFTANTSDFQAAREFRMVNLSGGLGGGFPGNKNSINGGETWTYCNNCLEMDGTSGAPATPGVDPSYTGPYPGSSADPTGGPAMDQGANFFGAPFSFLAPYQGTDAAAAYGTGTFSNTAANTWDFFFPVLESQWGGVFFPLGQASGGVHMTMELLNASGDFILYGEELIDAAEDPNNAGFAGWTAQWMYSGNVQNLPTTTPPAIPVPAAVWLFGSGLLGLVGVARRKKAV